MGEQPVVITRVAQRHWHALEDDRVVGRGEASRRSDGRIFLSIDAWRDAVFDQLADAVLADLPAPLYTVVDEADLDLMSGWQRAGFTTRRREWEYLVPTDPRVTGLGSVPPPPGVTMMPAGAARPGPLRQVYDTIRAEVETSVGWQAMPGELQVRPEATAVLDPLRYAVAAESDRYVGLVRVAARRGQARIGLVAVLADRRRRGIARGLLAHALDSLHRRGIETATAEVDEGNGPATALFEGVGARRASSNLELVWR
ncbi:MAG TPA: GNAT family N-acetyltransferase [Actinophytocola sp.]|uniref:GNAT family N-acetyltransferase n=1 Tax=Actinophytocola sp. TaxID=1872138 RepID=UPI002DB70583|nr:GNAT family N-acetyltransferase [Actinophytocola sp.]HEU5475088.1 GNAT family N-acetyltransferase [Actinophytocola sp.]